MAYLDDSIAQITAFEGSIPWMYLDTRGFVTVGVGEMLANATRAETIAFIDSTGQPCSAADILTEFQRVSALPAAHAAAFYRSDTSPTISAETVQSLLRDHLGTFETLLEQRFPDYSDFPDPAKLALLDMIFNLGPVGLFHGYPTMLGDISRGDWASAAQQCHRNGPSQQRNDWTRQQFLAAAAAPAAVPADAAPAS